MKNKVLSGLAFGGEVRFYIIDSKELVQYMHDINKSSKTSIAILGRSATITGLMGLMLKDNQKVTTILNGNGIAGQTIVDSNNKGEVKALISNPFVDIPLNSIGKIDVATAVGDGTLRVIKDLNMKEPFIGEVELISKEIAEDYTYYFTASEQIPTAVSAGVLVDTDYSIKSSGGFIVQLMPEASEKTINKLEKNILNCPAISKLLTEKTLEEILELLFEKDYEILKQSNVEFKCDCSKDKFIRGIRLLSKDEILEIKEDNEIVVNCDFCKTEYKIDTKEL